ncbi:MAG TPA: C45 family peptidase [Dehalococcoidia bacterium]|nr:C45 family peptidase [Dehalococcoidia bacterium]
MPIIGSDPIPIVLVEGEPRERGRQHGELARDLVALSVERYMERFAHFARLDPPGVRDLAAAFAPIIRDYDPDLLEEIEGVAEGAGFAREDLLAVNCRSEVMFGKAVPECTSFGLNAEVTANGHTYVGQNWDWAPDIKETLILLVVKQEPKPTIVLLDEAGMIGRMGLNDAGIGLATNTLISEQREIGVPYNMLLRGILNQRGMAQAIAALVRPKRAISANYLIGHGDGQTIDIEASPIHVDTLVPRDGIITHGNHFEGPRLQGRDLSLERFPDSAYRGCRLRDRLAKHSGSLTEADVQEALRDSFGHPDAICRAADPAQGRFDQLETVASIVIDATERRFWLARGAPSENAYHEFLLADLAIGKVPTPVEAG